MTNWSCPGCGMMIEFVHVADKDWTCKHHVRTCPFLRMTERRIDDHTWLEPSPCYAPVHAALWFSKEHGWQWPEQVTQVHGQRAEHGRIQSK